MEDKIIEWAEKFEKIVAEKMPDAIDLGLNYVRIDALANILFGLMMASIAIFAYRHFRKIIFHHRYNEFKEIIKNNEEDTKRILLSEFKSEFFLSSEIIKAIENDEVELIVPNILFIIIGTLCLAISMTELLSVWNWITLFSPKLGLIHQLMTSKM